MITDWWTDNPQVVSQWSSKNSLLTPQLVSKGSDRKVWWVCSKGHEWESRILARVNGHGCPYCSGRRPTTNTNLYSRRPDLIREWDYSENTTLPEDTAWVSNRSVGWICAFGHKWRTAVANRTRGNTGCPYCAGKLANPTTSLLSDFPLIAKEWHSKNKLGPDQVRPMTHSKFSWLCPNGHTYETSVASRTHLGTGCPLCAWQTSKLELRVYCELRGLLSGITLYDRSLGFEIDVFLTEQRVGIEIDGWYWHRGKIELDRRKSSLMCEAGVTPIRLRGIPLPMIGVDDIRFKKNPDQHSVVYKLVTVIERIINCSLDYNPDLWVNDLEYQRMILQQGTNSPSTD